MDDYARLIDTECLQSKLGLDTRAVKVSGIIVLYV